MFGNEQWGAAFFEWGATWLLLQKDGKVYKEDVRGVFDVGLDYLSEMRPVFERFGAFDADAYSLIGFDFLEDSCGSQEGGLEPGLWYLGG